ncbi:MAG TPA: bifunctional riboflavin kinase/FAD synthetase [Chloroflexota bacterium]|nr:bifunctional riboflavin kinase/FAD synthetase [Chloroflexota bacterium]
MATAEHAAQPGAPPVVVAIGAFDGVHRGHRLLLGSMVARARELGARAVCITFDPDPERVLRPEAPPQSLCSTAERVQRIREIGIDAVDLWPFTPEVAQMTPAEFVAAVCARYPVIEVWVGANFAFGRGRSGNVQTLAELGRRYGFAVHAVPPVYDGDRPISSSRIRELLRAGEVREAARLLGRPYRLAGEVIGGARRGRQLGFPTANLRPPDDQLLPAQGVYAGWAQISSGVYPAVANIGARPTFGEEQPLIEVHLLDFDGDLYGQHLAFDFADRLRTIRRFASLDELRAQIAQDIATARLALVGPR